MNKLLFAALTFSSALTASAGDIDITAVKYVGPYEVRTPWMVDSVDVNSNLFAFECFLDLPLPSADVFASSNTWIGDERGIALPDTARGLYLLGFSVQNTRFSKTKLSVDGLKDYRLFMDDRKVSAGELLLEPGVHRFVLEYLADGKQTDKLRIRISTERGGPVSAIDRATGRPITLHDVTDGRRVSAVSVSPAGTHLLSSYTTILPGGATSRSQRLTELATGRVLAERSDRLTWMPHSNRYYYTRKGAHGRELITVDPADGKETVAARNLPEGTLTFAPTEEYLIVGMTQEGPKERTDIYEILTPDDRQPGWRTRSYPAKFDLKTGTLQPLAYGHHNVYVSDISKDGKYLLLRKSETRLTRRPTTLTSVYRMNVETLQTELLVDKDGFVGHAQFSPDGTQVLISGTPESFAGIGKNVKPDQIPSMTDNQLFLMNLSDKRVTPLTKHFHPSVGHTVWSDYDNQIYFQAENKDSLSLYRLNPKDGKIVRLDEPEELVKAFSLAGNAPVLVYVGQGAMNSDRVYSMNLKRTKSVLIEDLSAVLLKGVELGLCQAWNFVNSRGDTIGGRYYLPPRFDPSEKYPLIVNYYGGCSPTNRNFESRYPQHLYAAMGYVVYVINPSGATGFGQEFSARHVNTAGEGVAQDIIEGTKAFCQQHSFVDEGKIGCIGASYGGFMTQYLQTKTDLFAAAVSHAGISDHTSYWGEGYWGYSYSEVSMADSYPWTRKDLFVDRSPLFNADKIRTPLLFLHGSADTNVPIGESIQMFTALKLLGRPTAFVVVDNQDHHILDYDKRFRWQNTIFAWFQKYLQDDDTWWEQLYPKKSL